MKNIDSYNRLINIIIGSRGIGKTYALKKKAILNFKRNGRKFIYFRRYAEEIKAIKNKLFSDVNFLEENEEIEIDGNDIYLIKKLEKNKKEKHHMGCFLWMAKSQTIKSANFSDYDIFIFDEFLIEDKIHHYFANEVGSNFISIVSTIIRNNDLKNCCKFYLLANSCTQYNPYFDYFKIKSLNKNKRFYTEFNKMICLEYSNNEVFIEQIRDTPFYELIKGTKEEDYIANNNFYFDDEESFILEKPTTAVYMFTLLYNGEYYGVYYDDTLSIMYVNDTGDKNYSLKFSATIKDRQPNFPIFKLNSLMTRFFYFYKNSALYFNSVKTREEIYDCLYKI